MFAVTVQIEGFDDQNQAHHDFVARLPYAATIFQAGDLAYVEAEVDLAPPAQAAWGVIKSLRAAPFTTVRLSIDLVTASDIARRSDVSRESVRLWASGERRAGFPLPFATAGGQKLWSWGDVYPWLVSHSDHAATELEGEAQPLTNSVIERFNGVLAMRRCSEADGWAHLRGKTSDFGTYKDAGQRQVQAAFRAAAVASRLRPSVVSTESGVSWVEFPVVNLWNVNTVVRDVSVDDSSGAERDWEARV